MTVYYIISRNLSEEVVSFLISAYVPDRNGCPRYFVSYVPACMCSSEERIYVPEGSAAVTSGILMSKGCRTGA